MSQLRSPLRQGPAGPTRSSTLPAHLSPGLGSRRPQLPSSDNSNGSARSSYQIDEIRSKRTSTEAPSAHQLPIHSGPPQSRAAYSPPVSGPAPVSPYATQPEARRGYPATVLKPQSTFARDIGQPRWDWSGVGAYLHLPCSILMALTGTRLTNTTHTMKTRETAQPLPIYRATPRTTLSSLVIRSPPPGNACYPAPPAHRYQNGYHAMQFEAEDIGNSGPRRRRGNLPRDTTDLLKSWFSDHLAHPYPTEDEKQMLCRRTGLAMTQVGRDAFDVLLRAISIG